MSLHPSNHVRLSTKHSLSWHFPRHDLHQHYPHAVDIALLSRLQRDLGEPEITQMCFHVGIQQHITGFNIPVQDRRNTIMMKISLCEANPRRFRSPCNHISTDSTRPLCCCSNPLA